MATGLYDLAFPVIGVAGLAPAYFKLIFLGRIDNEGHGFCGLTEADGQHPGSQRVQRPAMAGFLGMQQSLESLRRRLYITFTIL